MTAIPLNALRVFESVVRLDSFRAASEELNVTQSAISHQIRHLEQWFDMPLFDRSGSRPRVLPAGLALANALGRSLFDIQAACQLARTHHARASRLVLAAIPSIAVCWLIPRLSDFRKRHPEINIRVIYAFHGQAIDFSEVDFAFVHANTHPRIAGTRSRMFLPGVSVPVCSPGIAEARYAQYTIDKLPENLLLHDTNTLDWQTWFRRAGYPTPPFTGPVYEDFNLLRAAVLAGQGVALCAESMISEDLCDGRLVKLSDISVRESTHYYLVEPNIPAERMSMPVRAFHDWLVGMQPSAILDH